MLNDFITIDLETTIKNKIGGNKGSAFCPENKVVTGALKVSHDTPILFFTEDDQDNLVNPLTNLPDHILVGQNFKFDLHHLRRMGLWDLCKDRMIWDTMVAEYIITAQDSSMASLNALAGKYGGTQKLDIVKRLWDAGVQTEEIDRDLLNTYLRGDIENTELVAKAQMKRAKELGLYERVLLMCSTQLATAEMEWNGLKINEERMDDAYNHMLAELNTLVYDWIVKLSDRYPGIPDSTWSFTSPGIKSALLFGGDIKFTEHKEVGTKEVTRTAKKIPIGVYKNGKHKGQPRYRNVKEVAQVPIIESTERVVTIDSLCGLKPKPQWENVHGYSTKDDILKELQFHDETGFVKDLMRMQYLRKQIDTYCVGLKELIFDDGFIHHNLNHAITTTGRLSSSNPNMQNVPRDKQSFIKRFFVSRWGDDGVIVNLDYSQLEVIWLALVSNDERMIEDIRNGVDFHCKRLALKEGMDYAEVFRLAKTTKDSEWVSKRDSIKQFSFQRSYGAGAKAISEETGIPKAEVEEIIKAEEAYYTGIPRHLEQVKASCGRLYKPNTHEVEGPNGYPISAGTGFYKSITGRIYHYREKLSPEFMRKRGTMVSISPTIMKNYDIQGGATGELVPVMMYELFKKVKNNPDIKLINTVHDSIMLDVKKDKVDQVAPALLSFCKNVHPYLKEHLGVDTDLPFNVDCEYGPSWGEMEEL